MVPATLQLSPITVADATTPIPNSARRPGTDAPFWLADIRRQRPIVYAQEPTAGRLAECPMYAVSAASVLSVLNVSFSTRFVTRGSDIQKPIRLLRKQPPPLANELAIPIHPPESSVGWDALFSQLCFWNL